MAKLIISLTSLAVVLLSSFNSAQGMNCEPFQSQNFLERLAYNCPRPLIDSASQSYCCYRGSGEPYCCTFLEMIGLQRRSMDCKPFSNKNIIEQVAFSCPKPFINSDSQAYCCYDKDGNSYCCELPEFLVSTTAYLIVFLLVVLLLTSLISCVCCLCCPCCCLYKRRQSGGGIC
uniref:Uncharacterized protein n=1 Tax=Cacopsylla melanoneura TaxID=428564 RepID=A0A8D8UND9_9HEMI